MSIMKIAYLASRYPAVSHTFIMREIAALREHAFDVHTFTVRRTSAMNLLTQADREENDRTVSLLPAGLWRIACAHIVMLFASPRGYLSAFWAALTSRRPGLKAAAWQLFYFAEAGILARELRRRGIHHLHVHFANVAAEVAGLVSRMTDVTWSLTLHGLADFGNPEVSRVADKIARARFVICVSDFGRAQCMLVSPSEHWSKINVVHCGLNPAQFSPTQTTPRLAEDKPFRLLNVARLGPEKGHVVLLDALCELKRTGCHVSCVIVGDGPMRKRLEQTVREYGLAEDVRLVGAVGQDEIAAYYGSADAFVLPSLSEGLPVVLMEAMAMKLPVVASRIMGIPELVEHGVQGLLVSPARPSELAEEIQRLAADSAMCARMGAAGRDKVCSDFDLRKTTEAFVRVLNNNLPEARSEQDRYARASKVGVAQA